MAAVIKVVALFCLLIVALTTYLSLNQRKFLYNPDQQPLDGEFQGYQVAAQPEPQPQLQLSASHNTSPGNTPVGYKVVGIEGLNQARNPVQQPANTTTASPPNIVGAEAVLQQSKQPDAKPVLETPTPQLKPQPAAQPSATPTFSPGLTVAEVNAQIAAQNAATRALEKELEQELAIAENTKPNDLLSLDDLVQKRQSALPDPANQPPLPPPLKPDDLGPKFELVSVVTDDGLELKALYAVPAAAEDKVILYFHGNGGNANHRLDKARELYAEGYGVYLAEYRGYAGNPGEVSERGLKLDALAHLAYAITSMGSASQVILYGESLGTGLAVYAASDAAKYGEEPVHAVVLEAPYSSILDVASEKFWWVPGKKYLLQDTYDSMAHVNDIKAPLLIVHGKRDKTIPVALAEKLYAAAAEPKKLVIKDDAGHNDLYARGALSDITKFLKKLQ